MRRTDLQFQGSCMSCIGQLRQVATTMMCVSSNSMLAAYRIASIPLVAVHISGTECHSMLSQRGYCLEHRQESV